MRLTLDDDTKKVVVVDDSGVRREFDFYTPEAFHYLSAMWVKMGWGLKYIYTFTWMGRPIIQLPDDMYQGPGSNLFAEAGRHCGDGNCTRRIFDLLCLAL